MGKFRTVLMICLLMAVAVPFAPQMAVSDGSPAYTHYIYMAGHNGWLHYAANAWSLLVLHNLLRWYRVAAAYAVAVLIGYVALPPQPMVGASVMTCFFLGFATPWLWYRDRLAVVLSLALLLLTCLLPGFAGIPHILSWMSGIVFSLTEGWIRRMNDYLKD